MFLNTLNRVVDIKKAGYNILLLFIATYILPVKPYIKLYGTFSFHSWIRAINYAVNNNIIFGTKFIYTYGPLGFLDTRNSTYINGWYFIIADLFLFIGFYYLLQKYLSKCKPWISLILFISLFVFQNAGFCQKLFLVYIALCSYSIQNNFSKKFETVYIAIAAAALLYIKLNFGFFAFLLLLFLSGIAIVRKKYSFFLIIICYLLMLCCLNAMVHIAFFDYIATGWAIVNNYADAMYMNLPLSDFLLLSAGIYTALFGIIIALYISQTYKNRQINLSNIAPLLILTVSLFFFYKSSFTRSDSYHYEIYFETVPLFFILMIMILKIDSRPYALFFVFAIIALSTADMWYEVKYCGVDIPVKETIYEYTPFGYFMGLKNKSIEDPELAKGERFAEKDLKFIGRNSIDIFPYDISLLLVNNLNYHPRPIPQTYTCYSAYLDSVNAAYFASTERPEYLMMSNESIDGRYFFWDESRTNATINLEYSYCIAIKRISDSSNANFPGYLVLKKLTRASAYPIFQKISELHEELWKKITINFPDSVPVYMSATIKYNFIGQLDKLLYKPPHLQVRLFYDDGTDMLYRAIIPEIQAPVLINKSVKNMEELKNYFTCDLKKNKNIIAFQFEGGLGIEKEFDITFYNFSNYKEKLSQ